MNERYIDNEFTYDLIKEEDVTNKLSKPKVKCSKCDFVMSNTIVSDFLHCPYKKECDNCHDHRVWNKEKFEEEIPQYFLDSFDYSLIISSSIVNADSTIPIICKKCQCIFHRTVYEHVKEFLGCKFCNKSNGEKHIYMYLKSLDLSFTDQLSIMGPNGYYCFYDFEIYHSDGKIILELDGFQHFFPVDHFHKTRQEFENARTRDIYKHYMALKSGKRVVRIDYTVENKITEYIDVALKSQDKEYFSNPGMYQWLIEGVQKMFENENN